MSRKLEIDAFVSSTVGFPPKSGTWNFLQQAHQETTTAILKEMIGINYDPAIGYVLYGMESVVAGPFTDFSAGAVFFGGEVFIFPIQTHTNPSGSDVFLVNIRTTQYTTNADPVTFTDTTIHNVHNIRNGAIATGTTGTGQIADYSALVYLQYAWTEAPSLTATITPSNTIAIASTAYNKYKFANGVFTWTFRLKCTLTGTTATVCTFTMSSNPINSMFVNLDGIYQCSYIADGSPLPQPAHVKLLDGGGVLQVAMVLPSTSAGTFTAGTNNYFDMTIVTEMVSLGL